MASKRSNKPQAPEGDLAVVEKTTEKTKKPKMYKVLIHNDDYTSMEFVVHVLTAVFHHEHDKAVQVMLHVHNHGVGVAGVYSYEVAESKVERTMRLARAQEFPLRASLEPES